MNIWELEPPEMVADEAITTLSPGCGIGICLPLVTWFTSFSSKFWDYL